MLDSLNTLQYLGIALVHNHRYDEAKKLFSDVIERWAKPRKRTFLIAWYNFACVAATAHDPDRAVEHLREAVGHGYEDIDHIRADDDLKSLHGHPRFEEFLTDARKRAEAPSPQHN